MWTKYRLYKDDDNHNMVIWESVTDTDFVGVGVDQLFKNSKQLYIWIGETNTVSTNINKCKCWLCKQQCLGPLVLKSFPDCHVDQQHMQTPTPPSHQLSRTTRVQYVLSCGSLQSLTSAEWIFLQRLLWGRVCHFWHDAMNFQPLRNLSQIGFERNHSPKHIQMIYLSTKFTFGPKPCAKLQTDQILTATQQSVGKSRWKVELIHAKTATFSVTPHLNGVLAICMYNVCIWSHL